MAIEYLKRAAKSPETETGTARKVVEEMLAQIEARGETAVREYAEQLDHWTGAIVMTPEAVERRVREVPWTMTVPQVLLAALCVVLGLVPQAPLYLAHAAIASVAGASLPPVTRPIPRGADSVAFDVPIPDPHLWTLDDPFLYRVSATVTAAGTSPPGFVADSVKGYFGMRSISVVTVPFGTNRYVALNARPLYLQLALDQSCHATVFYTFPSYSLI